MPTSTPFNGDSRSSSGIRERSFDDEQEFQPVDLLLLFLGVNRQLHALPPSSCTAFEFLTMQELQTVRVLSKSIYAELSFITYVHCRDGRDYKVPFPGFPGLFSTPHDVHTGAGLFPHQLASLRMMHEMENNLIGGNVSLPSSSPLPPQHQFGALRGGVLADAPGLGKTITILALISSTAGQRPTTPPEFWSSSDVDENWKALRMNPVAAQDLYATIHPIRKWMEANIDRRRDTVATMPQQQQGGWVYHENFRRLQSDLEPPFPGQRFPTIQSFESYVKKTLRQSCGVPRGQLDLFRMQMVHLKAGLDKKNRKLLKSTSIGRRLRKERNLLPSSATLVVVPDALLEHWYQQIIQHLDLSRFADESGSGNERKYRHIPRGVVYLDGIGDICEARMPLTSIRFNQVVPSPWELSQYFIVVTSFSRCEAEYNRLVDSGHLAEETSSYFNSSSMPRKRLRPGAPAAVQGSDSSLTLLLRIRWLRLVVDEGQELGMHGAGTSVTRFIHEIAAERRWVASGTPTTGNEDDQEFTAKALDQLQRLLVFLRHPKYGDIPSESSFASTYSLRADSDSDDERQQRKRQAKQEWELLVKYPFLEKQSSGRDEVERVLREIMVIHRKEDINLPKPIFEQADIDVAIPEEVQMKIRDFRNPMLSKAFFNDYLHSTEYQTLVDQAQARYIVDNIRYARQALNERGGPIVESQKAISDYSLVDVRDDRRPIKAVVYSSNSNVLLSVTDHLYRNLSFENIAELYGNAKIGDLGMELSRFRNGFKEQRTCPICHRPNDIEDKGTPVARCQQTLLEVVATSSAVPGEFRRFLIEPERIVGTVNVPEHRMGDETLSSYSKSSKFWSVGDVLEVDLRDPHPMFGHRESEDTWKDWGSEECKELAASQSYLGPEWYMGSLPSGEEGGDMSRCVVELAKWQKCSQFHGRWYKGPRLLDASSEKVKEDVFILALDASLATGLDLSFVTHIFLLEAIDDAAMLEQVTSRAHRLGATGSVVIDTVNTFWKLPKETEEALEEKAADSFSSSPAKQLEQDKQRTLHKVVCSFCYRQFESIAKAEDHERLTCQRNPDSVGVADPFHLSSIYEKIRPPSALEDNVS